MQVKRRKCRQHGYVMAVSSDQSTFRERQQMTMGPALLTVLTCGLALPITLPIMVFRLWRRDREAKTFRCPVCGKSV